MSIVWDVNRATEVPGVLNAYRGTFLNFAIDADIVHPVTLQYKTLKEYAFNTNRMVLDFVGGQPLPVPKEEQEDKPLYAPTECLLLNEKGELFVTNELDDWDGFKKHMPPVPAAATDTMGGPGMGEMPGMPGMSGYGGSGDGETVGGRGRGRGRGDSGT